MSDTQPTPPEDAAGTIRCRYCGQRNKTKKRGDAKCGRCLLSLAEEPHKKFAALDKHDYVHPLDSRALAALRMIPGIDTALKKLLEVLGEAQLRVVLMASAVKVTQKQAPDLFAKLQVACATLGVDMPDMYLLHSPVVNAFTYGSEKPVIVLHTALLDHLNDEEVLCVIAHEVGHIHAQHSLYLTAALILELLANTAIGISPIAALVKQIISMTMRGALLSWQRCAELSCDRAALLVTQDPGIVGHTMMKLCGGSLHKKLNYHEFLEQAREFQKVYDDSALDRFWADILNAGQTHPFPIWRVSEILKWVDSGEYQTLMEGRQQAKAA